VAFVVLLAGSGQTACARPSRIEALQATHTAVATLDDWGALLLEAGLPPRALPTGETLTLEQVKHLRLLLSLPTSMEHYAPRRVADTLLREAEEARQPVRREVLNQQLQRFQSRFTLRPDGMLSAALTGRPQQWMGLVEPRDGALRAGAYEVGVWYQRGEDDVMRRVMEVPSPQQCLPPSQTQSSSSGSLL
jgi:hypothetical protein